MNSELAALEELQSLDLETLDFRKELVAIPNSLTAMEEDVAHVGELLTLEKNRLKEAEEWRTERDKDIALQNDLLTKSKAKLQTARNEKEMKAAQREIDTIRKNIQDREEEAIKVMEAIEQYRTAIEEHTKEFAELEAQLAASQEQAVKRMAELETEIGKTDARRREICGRIEQKTLRLYERINKRYGLAVVEAKEGCCAGCHMEILPQMYNELQRGDKVYQCANCFRILIFRPEPEPELDSEE